MSQTFGSFLPLNIPEQKKKKKTSHQNLMSLRGQVD